MRQGVSDRPWMAFRDTGRPASIVPTTGAGSGPDFRAPADPQDFETTVSRPALPPGEFTITTGESSNTITISDRELPSGRAATASYRVYFLPTSLSGTLLLDTAAKRTAAVKMSSLVATVSATGRGEDSSIEDARFFGQGGYYLCVAVNQRGAESPVEHVVRVP